MQKSQVTIEWEGTRKDTLTETAIFDGTEACLGKILGRPLMYPSIKLPNKIVVTDSAGRQCTLTVIQRGTRKVANKDVPCLHVGTLSNSIPVTPSSYEEQEWRCINREGNNYKKYFLREVPGGLEATYGSIDVPKNQCKVVRGLYEPLMFYALDAEKRSKGYVNVTQFTMAGNYKYSSAAGEVGAERIGKAETDNEKLFSFLMALSKKIVQTTVDNPDGLTPMMISEAKKALSEMKKAISDNDFDGFCDAQEKLMLMIPHKRNPMQGNKVLDYMPTSIAEMPQVYDDEESRVNAAEAFVLSKTGKASKCRGESFKQYGLHAWKATAEQKQWVLDRINPNNRASVKAIYRIKPDAQIKKFDAFKKKHDIHGSGTKDGTDLGIQHYFHGSDNANWFSILKDGGLRNMPAVHGRMFGDLDKTACYYAPSFDKAGGYRSSSCRWNNGNSRIGIVGLFAVCMGKPLYVTRQGQYTHADLAKEGKNSIYAKASLTGLRSDEVVAEMSCLEYLIITED